MINSDNLCMSCMKDIGDLKQCPHCGFHVDSQQIAPYLPIRTVLGNRYLVGKLLEYNGDGATYMGLDLTSRQAVNIREFFPVGLAERDPKTLVINAKQDDRVQYNEYLQSFIGMWRKLKDFSGLSALIKVYDILEGSGTCYVITENIEGITLREYLLRNEGGYISWEKARPLLMPVLSTLGTLHSSGIIHRGISPSTLVVAASDGKIRITGFSISSVRSARSDLKPQLYTGYAAFEQYGFDGRQGTWTDVYGFGAVLYRTLIGTDPIDSKERVTNDRLMVPGKFAEQLPAYVINGLVNSLQILPEDRTRTVDELRAELSAAPSATVSGLNLSAPQGTQNKYQSTAQRLEPDEEEEEYFSEKREAAQKRHNRSSAVIAIATIIIILAVAFLVLWKTGVIDLDAVSTTAAESEMVAVPNFVGKAYDDIIEDTYYKRNFKFEKSEVYSSSVEQGIVIKQSEEVDSSVAKDTVIKLTVSKGKETIVFPSSGVEGVEYEQAYSMLTSLGFDVQKSTKLNNSSGTPGVVASASAEKGASYEKGTTIYLIVWGEVETTTTEKETTESDYSDYEDDETTEANVTYTDDTGSYEFDYD